MVRGLQRFKEYFAEFKDRYVLIGGVAMVISLEEAGLQPRATKDLDLVLCLETLDQKFTLAFWQFVREGGYEGQKGGDGKTRYYRFRNPKGDSFPQMLELFSREPDHFDLADDATLTPVPAGECAEDLSAILLDNAYYDFIRPTCQATVVAAPQTSAKPHPCGFATPGRWRGSRSVHRAKSEWRPALWSDVCWGRAYVARP
jgi:hypothetical protein